MQMVSFTIAGGAHFLGRWEKAQQGRADGVAPAVTSTAVSQPPPCSGQPETGLLDPLLAK